MRSTRFSGCGTLVRHLVLAFAAGASCAHAATLDVASPQGEVGRVRQVRLGFSEAMVKFGDPELPAPAEVSCKAEAPVKGAGRWVDANNWVYDFTADLAPGTRCRVELKTGLSAAGGGAVTGKTQFEFFTGGPAVVRSYPASQSYAPIVEDQAFALLLNGPVSSASVLKNAWCEAAALAEKIPVKLIEGADREAILQAVHLVPVKARVVILQCSRPLPPGNAASLVLGKGIATPSGVASSQDFRLSFKVRNAFSASFTCERSNANADCLPIRPMRLEFSAPVPRSVAQSILLEGPGGPYKPALEQGRGEMGEQLLAVAQSGGIRHWLYRIFSSAGEVKARPDDSPVSAVVFNGPFQEKSPFSVQLPKGFADDAGRTLLNASDFPIQTRTDAAPPLAKFPNATFGILELNAEPMLPLTVRQVEGDLAVQSLALSRAAVSDLKVSQDKQIIDWLAKLHRYDESILSIAEVERELGIKVPIPPRTTGSGSPRPVMRYGEAQRDIELPEWSGNVETRSLSLLDRQAGTRKLELPARFKTEPHPFEVIGIPMPDPGFHVVELASPRLGKVLLDRDAPMYVRTSVLVTNLGVHFKWGAVNSGVWVTTLDTAKPVGAAQIQISDCLGKPVWSGSTDAQGFVLVAQELPELPYQYCAGHHGGNREQGYFVSARKADAQGRADMAFVWSSWNQGIEAWRFNLNQGNRGEPARTLLHTVFDRTLLRAGQTVSMKHYARAESPIGQRLMDEADLPTTLQIVHEGTGQEFKQPLEWRDRRHAESTFKLPEDAKLGVYDVNLIQGGRRVTQTGSFRVEEFRVPVMTGRISAPKGALISPKTVELGVQLNYINGGGAAGLPVRVSAQMDEAGSPGAVAGDRYPGFSFNPPRPANETRGGNFFEESYADEGDEDSDGHANRSNGDARLVADKLPLKLDAKGAGTIRLPDLPAVTSPRELLVQATYADPNGEVQTLSQTLALWPSALVLGVRNERWVSVQQKVATQVVALDTQGRPQAGAKVSVHAVLHSTNSSRRRLVGGFYAYDNQAQAQDLGEVCSGSSDARGLVFCEVELKAVGEVELVASAKDDSGHEARAAGSVWVTRQGEVWFGGDNQDRMDVLPELRNYEPGRTARLQVRSPFRHATALVAIERMGIIETRTVELDGRDPTIELPIKPEWAPNVFVSVLAVRGRVREVPWYSLFTWGWHAPVDWWHAYRDEGGTYQAPTAMVDLSKPAFKYGVTEIKVGIASHALKVDVMPDKASYPVRAVSRVKVKVRLPGGAPAPAGTEVALAAVDEALLELKPNTSWDLLSAMIRPREYGIETATAQMQIIGKRHFGKKAVPAGGGGGAFPSRELFDTLLLWNPRVVLDANGEATVDVPLNDSLTSFRIVAIADVVAGGNAALFGTGQATIRSTQDLQLVSGLPPLVREGDHYRAMFTLRNTTGGALDATVSAQAPAGLPVQTVHLEANSAAEVGWAVEVPFNVKTLEWQVAAKAGAAQDRMKLIQQVGEAVPVTVRQSTLMQLDKPLSLPVSPPAKALAGADGALRGGIELGFKPRLADGMPGVTDYFRHYPWGCLEQLASIAVGTRNTDAWKALMRQLPLYLDEDGLANYFPPSAGQSRTGSDALTAYLLALSDEASRLGADFTLPPDARAKMEDGLGRFVEGRIKRDFWMPAFLKNGDLDMRKLAAIEALSRDGKARPAMLDSVQIVPNQWPTAALIDWMMILERLPGVPDHDKRSTEAEQILRARLNVQGTRLGFSTERDDNWWWLMANGDSNSVRMILAVMDRPAWREDMPRLVTGALQRQQFGHWSTTVANAWGSVAIEAFGKRFEREAVTGTTRSSFGAEASSQSLDWKKLPKGGSLLLAWPPAGSDGTLKISQDGSGKPWVTISSKAAVPLAAPFSAGYRITKRITPVTQQTKGQYSRGDVLRIHLDIDVQADATWVVLDDPIPGGSTILGNGLGRDSAIDSADEQTDDRGWLAYQERSFAAFRAYYRYLPKGNFQVEYTIRLNNPGQFGMPPTHVETMYAPEMFGEVPNATMVVGP